MNPIEAGLVPAWTATYGDLNLWDFYTMNAYLKYKDRVDATVAHQRAIRETAHKAA